jgi:hypothetical protein
MLADVTTATALTPVVNRFSSRKDLLMTPKLCFSVVVLFAGSLCAADPGPKEEVQAAAKKLAEQPNYSWRTTVTVPQGAQFRPGPTEGQATKDGLAHITMTFGDNEFEVVVKGDKAAVLDEDGSWVSAAELENAEGRGRFLARFARGLSAPAAQAAELASQAKELKKEGEAISGELTEEGAKSLLRFRRGADGPEVANAKGRVKFWLKDGSLAKYEYQVQGTVNFNGNDVDIDRTTTTEIKDVGTTKLEVADQAKKIVQ